MLGITLLHLHVYSPRIFTHLEEISYLSLLDIDCTQHSTTFLVLHGANAHGSVLLCVLTTSPSCHHNGETPQWGVHSMKAGVDQVKHLALLTIVCM